VHQFDSVSLNNALHKQGAGNGWISSFKLAFSLDGVNFVPYFGGLSKPSPLVLSGNFDNKTAVPHNLQPAAVARFVRFLPILPANSSANFLPALRIQVVGCFSQGKSLLRLTMSC